MLCCLNDHLPLKFIAKFGLVKFGGCAPNLVETCRKD